MVNQLWDAFVSTDLVTKLFMAWGVLHVVMLGKAIIRRQWGWFWAMFVIPVADIIYLFKK